MKNFLRAAMVAIAAIMLVQASPARADNHESQNNLELAIDVLQASGAASQFDTVLPLVFNQVQQLVVQQKPDHRKAIEEIFTEMQVEAMANKDELIEQIAGLYAAEFSADELNDLLEFFKTDTGQHMVRAMPNLMQGAMQLGQRWGQQVGAKVMERAMEEMQKRGI